MEFLDASRPRAVSRRAAALSLFGIAVLILLVSGSVGVTPPDAQDRSTAAVAGALAGLSVIVARGEQIARRVLGAAFAVLVVAISLGAFVPDFHFVWESRSLSTLGLLVVLSAVSLGLLAPSLLGGRQEFAQDGSGERPHANELAPWRSADGGLNVEARTVLWMVTGIVGSVVGYDVGEQSGHPVAGTLVAAAVVTGLWGLVTARRGMQDRGF